MHSDDDTNPSDAAVIEQAAALEAQAETNRRTVVSKAGKAIDDLGKLIASTDATLNANPAVNLRVVARAVRLLLRLELDRYEGTD